MTKSIVCVGQNCIDVIVRGFEPENAFQNEATAVENVSLSLGGDATNEACVLGKMGYPVKLVFGLAPDPSGKFILDNLQSMGVDTFRAVPRPEALSAVNCVIVNRDAERNFLLVKDVKTAQFKLSPEMVIGAKIVSLGSLFHPPFLDPRETAAFVAAAKEEGAIVCADFCMNADCKLADYAEVFQNLDYIFPNAEEAEYYVPGKASLDEVARVFLDMGVKHVVIKEGKKGSSIWYGEEKLSIKPYLVKPVDTTGAGDNFAAGFIAALFDGKALPECGKFASAAAAIAVQHIGATGGVRSVAQVQAIIDAHQ